MLSQLLQIGIALFAGGCALMVLRTVVEVLPELLAVSGPAQREGAPVPVPVDTHRRGA